MCLYFARFRLRRGPHIAPYSRLIEAFIILNVISIAIGFYVGSRVTPILVINNMLRILDSYFIYIAIFIAASRYRYTSVSPFVKAIVIGSAIAVFANVIAIKFGLGGGIKGSGTYASLRERGLYYDPGALSNVAFFNLIFAVFMLHLVKRQKLAWYAFIAAQILGDLYLINAGKSRAVMVELAVFGFIYLLLFQKRWGKIAAPIVAAGIVAVSLVTLDIKLEELFVRFETDISAIEQADESGIGIANTGQVTLGQFERLGSNRGANWAAALTEIINRPVIELLLGNFTTTMAHSDYVDVLSGNGIVGLIMYCSLLAGLTWRSFLLTRRRDSPPDIRVLHFISFTLIACYVLYAFPFRPLRYTTTAWYMWVMLGFSMATRKYIYPRPVPKSARADQGSLNRLSTMEG